MNEPLGVDGQVLSHPSRLAAYANFVKVAHTVFALPFAVVGLVTAARVYPVSLRTIALAVLAFGAARFAAMGFNRIADLRWDRINPRTRNRELPAGRLSLVEAWTLVALMSAVFVACAWLLNPVCLALAPVALAWILGYSFSKRFTVLSHLWLGVGLAIAPVGGYLAVAGTWGVPWALLVTLAAAVACWVAGFDTLYALQDQQFDREQGLKSAPVALGARGAIRAARALHVAAIALLLLFWYAGAFGGVLLAAIVAAGALLLWEHRLVRVDDYAKLDAAFFSMNGVIAIVVMVGALGDVLL